MKNSNHSDDRRYMKLALEQAKQQKIRFGHGQDTFRPDPLVGCVVVTSDGRIETGYRGELNTGDHAEFTVLEKKLQGIGLEDSVIYTTLEPCTNRGPGKISCAERIIKAGVKRVFIGDLDLDDRGRGYQKLADSKIAVQLFDDDFVQEIRELNSFFIESRKKSSFNRPWFEEIESACNHRIKIIADLEEAPKMNRIGEYAFPVELIPKYKIKLEENRIENKGWNEQIAEYKGIRDFGKVIDYEEYNYIQWKTLRDAGYKPRSVYAGAILVCPEEGCIFVHRRAFDVATEPGKLHGFLGAFIVHHQNQSDENLLHACFRELHEESSAQPSLENSRVLIVENIEIGWIDVMFMAGIISNSNAKRLKGSGEGEVQRLDFDQLEQKLISNPDEWVSNGIAHHLIWLKLNAPGSPAWFQKKSHEMYKRISEHLLKQAKS